MCAHFILRNEMLVENQSREVTLKSGALILVIHFGFVFSILSWGSASGLHKLVIKRRFLVASCFEATRGGKGATHEERVRCKFQTVIRKSVLN